MGNQLSGIAPSQIYPVEHYFTELPEYQFESSLGSTRFFKVAKAKFKEGPVVVKVFAIHDPSLPLKGYRKQLEDCKNKLIGAPNCLTFQKLLMTEKACLLFRQYVRDNLYDRISTRPFLNLIEKKWLAFQLLSALSQSHRVGICHGDIKLENIMVTGWNWVLLSDFATYKPTFLPEDNPADFSYFFDTSRRRTCYIAPERFVKTLLADIGSASSTSHLILPDSDFQTGELTPAMDIFSAGCALVELFTEGHAPFNFSQLLSYRSGDYRPASTLDKIEDSNIRDLVSHMIQKDPLLRSSADKYLQKERGKAFPHYFYTFLDKYVQGFSTIPILFPDEKILRLHSDMKEIICVFGRLSSLSNDDNKDENILSNYGSEGLEIIITLVTSCLRAVKFCKGKLQALKILMQLTPHLSHDVILDRLLPYMLFLVNDPLSHVRMTALETLTKCLTFVETVPRSDANIFPEYILPRLAPKAQDESVIVRICFARNIALLADTALKYLEKSQINNSFCESSIENHFQYQSNYENELSVLHEMVQQIVSTLLLDTDNIVKQTLLEFGITRLCVFFGRQKANDVLLSHMITVLNDKDDRHLRGAFFDNIVGVAAYIGWQCSPIIKPLLQQGLNDTDEFVTSKALVAMSSLTELGIFPKHVLYDLLSEAAPFLCHPNLWIRQSAVGFVYVGATTLGVADVLSKLLPMVQPFLKYPVFHKEVVLLGVLQDPVPRPVLDMFLRSAHIVELLVKLQSNQAMRKLNYEPNMVKFDDADNPVNNVYKRLVSNGMNDTVEEVIVSMKDNLLKVHKGRKWQESKAPLISEHEGKVDLVKLPHVQRRHAVVSGEDGSVEISAHGRKVLRNRKQGNVSFDSSNQLGTMNEEWQHMFGSMDTRSPSPKLQQSSQSTLASQLIATHSQNLNPSYDIENSSLASKTYTQQTLGLSFSQTDARPSPRRLGNLDRFAIATDSGILKTCSAESCAALQNLLERKAQQHIANSLTRKTVQTASADLKQPPSGWKPRGTLVAHLHEHKAAVNRVLVIPSTTLFASCSNDGTVKIWDCDKMEKKSICNRSRQTYSRQGSQIVSLAICQNFQMACASDNASIHVFEIETALTKMTTRYTRNLDSQEEGCVADMHYFDTGSQSILAYATMYGSIVGWDLRSPGTAWKLENESKHGLITSFCVDPRQSWLAVGTSNGSHICWDLRFHLPISTVIHPTNARVRRLELHPTQQSWVVSAVQGNNEISIWDMETGSRQTTLWASSAPPLSLTHVMTVLCKRVVVNKWLACEVLVQCSSLMCVRLACEPHVENNSLVKNASNHSAYSMCIANRDGSPALISAGSDARIRVWNLNKPEDSYIMVEAANDVINPAVVSYKSQLIDGTEVIREVYGKPRPGIEDVPRRGPDTPPPGHHDCISDVAVYQTSQWLLVSASCDGLIKVWK